MMIEAVYKYFIGRNDLTPRRIPRGVERSPRTLPVRTMTFARCFMISFAAIVGLHGLAGTFCWANEHLLAIRGQSYLSFLIVPDGLFAIVILVGSSYCGLVAPLIGIATLPLICCSRTGGFYSAWLFGVALMVELICGEWMMLFALGPWCASLPAIAERSLLFALQMRLVFWFHFSRRHGV